MVGPKFKMNSLNVLNEQQSGNSNPNSNRFLAKLFNMKFLDSRSSPFVSRDMLTVCLWNVFDSKFQKENKFGVFKR